MRDSSNNTPVPSKSDKKIGTKPQDAIDSSEAEKPNRDFDSCSHWSASQSTLMGGVEGVEEDQDRFEQSADSEQRYDESQWRSDSESTCGLGGGIGVVWHRSCGVCRWVEEKRREEEKEIEKEGVEVEGRGLGQQDVGCQTEIAKGETRDLKKGFQSKVAENPFTSTTSHEADRQDFLQRLRHRRVERQALSEKTLASKTGPEEDVGGSRDAKPENGSTVTNVEDDASRGDNEAKPDVSKHAAAARLFALGAAMEEEVRLQRQHLNICTFKSNYRDDDIPMNKERLARIH